MNEIRFACPHCHQHILCDSDYGDLTVSCPTCGQPLVVPRLSPAVPPHPAGVVVASVPTPRHISRPAALDYWTEEAWERHAQAHIKKPQPTPAWLLSALATVILATLFRASGLGNVLIVLSILTGSALSCFLLIRGRGLQTIDISSELGSSFISAMLHAGLLMLLLPVVALGIALVGCGVCAGVVPD